VLRENMIFAARFTTITEIRKYLQQRLPVFVTVHLAEDERLLFV
jgi:hypothetical protein